MVFQSYALYPHMTVYDNLAFSLRVARVGKPKMDLRVRRAAAMMQLEPYLGRRPRELSGGQRQLEIALAFGIAGDQRQTLSTQS